MIAQATTAPEEKSNRDTAMTLIGKLLAFLNLLAGVAMVVWSVSLYTQRPGWFDPKEEGVTAEEQRMTFALLKEDIDALGRAATSASAQWGAQLKRLEGLEKQRADRLAGYTERLNWARNGRPNDPNQAGFFEPVYEPGTGLLDLSPTAVGPALPGPDNKPLKGVSRLGSTTTADVLAVEKRSKEITAVRDKFRTTGIDILLTEARLLKMGEVRDSVQSELFHLETFEVNVYETRETVMRRKRQLTARLAELGMK